MIVECRKLTFYDGILDRKVFRYEIIYAGKQYLITVSRKRNDIKIAKKIINHIAWSQGGFCRPELFHDFPRYNITSVTVEFFHVEVAL